MVLTIVSRPPEGSSESYRTIVHQDVPEDVVREIVDAFVVYKNDDGERFVHVQFESEAGEAEEIRVDCERTVLIHAHPPSGE